MAKTVKPAFNPPLGRMPVLQFLPPIELAVDPVYQRSAESRESQILIKRIAVDWDWDLCLPLVVARRMEEEVERFFVIDGQHRLEAAKLRGDIHQLPCVVLTYADVTREAANFVKLNQQRKPLSKLDLFKAAIASGDPEAHAIVEAMSEAGLTLAPHSNPVAWKPGMVANVAGIETAWRRHGARATSVAMQALKQAYPTQVLKYAGTIFPGLACVCADEIKVHRTFDFIRLERFITMLAIRSQDDWRRDISDYRIDKAGINSVVAAETIMRDAWRSAAGPRDTIAAASPPPAPKPVTPPPAQRFTPVAKAQPAKVQFGGKRWCDQCDRNVEAREATACRDKFCTARAAA